MSSYNNRLNCVMPLHRKSERNRKGHVVGIVKSRQARELKRNVKTRVKGSSKNLPDAESRALYARICEARNEARAKQETK